MNHPEIPYWIAEFYRRIDAGDPSSVDLWDDDIYVECANFPPTRGKAAAFGSFGRILEVISGVRHEVLAFWEVSPDEVVCRFRVNYMRRDGRLVKLQAITTLRRNAAGLIDDLRLSIDLAPIFDRISARMTDAASLDTSSAEAIGSAAIWSALRTESARMEYFPPGISLAAIVEEDADTLVRDIVIDGFEFRERVSFQPDHIVITRLSGEQHGDIHILLGAHESGHALSVQFDFVWHGVMPTSAFPKAAGRRLAEAYLKSFTGLMGALKDGRRNF